MTGSQQSLLAQAYLSKVEWYEHGQSGQAAKALARMDLAILRPASGGVGNYIAPAMKLTEAGVLAAQQVGEPTISQAILILQAKQRMGREPK